MSTPEPNAVELELKNDGSEHDWIPGPVVQADNEVERPLIYAANASNHWKKKGWVDLYSSKGTYEGNYNQEEQFRRYINADYMTEYGVQAAIIKLLQVSHFSNRKAKENHGGIVRDIGLEQMRWLPLQGNWKWSDGFFTNTSGASGQKFAVTDIAIPDYYTVACRAKANSNTSQIDLWAANGRYRLALGSYANSKSGLYIYDAPYGKIKTQVETMAETLEAKRWYWLKIQKWGNYIAAYIDDDLVAEFTDEKLFPGSEVAIGSDAGDVDFERVLVS